MTAPVEEDHRLLAALETASDGLKEPSREDDLLALRRILLTHVHDFDLRQRTIFHPAREANVFVLFGFCVAEGLHGGSRRTEYHDRTRPLCAHDGCVAGVVARNFLLLVAGFMFFIDNNEAEVL